MGGGGGASLLSGSDAASSAGAMDAGCFAEQNCLRLPPAITSSHGCLLALICALTLAPRSCESPKRLGAVIELPVCVGGAQGYQLGETKVFLRAGQMASLDKLRTELMNRCAVVVQRHVKGFTARCKYLRTRRAAVTVQVTPRPQRPLCLATAAGGSPRRQTAVRCSVLAPSSSPHPPAAVAPSVQLSCCCCKVLSDKASFCRGPGTKALIACGVADWVPPGDISS